MHPQAEEPRGAVEIKLVPLSVSGLLGKATLCGAYSRERNAKCASACQFCPSKSCESSNAMTTQPPPKAASQEIETKRSRCRQLCCRPHSKRVQAFLRPCAASTLRGPLRYIADTGSAFNIANSDECSRALLAKIVGLEPAWEMSTVNGPLTVKDGLRIEVPALKEGKTFAVLPHSPSIISLGRLCMLDGYSLHLSLIHI